MMITSFIINIPKGTLTINRINSKSAQVSFEYLRVFSPTTGTQQQALVSHKKSTILISIENIGKHGYRFVFDDQHSAIYTSDYLKLLVEEHDKRWEHYLSELKASGHSREPMINITQL